MCVYINIYTHTHTYIHTHTHTHIYIYIYIYWGMYLDRTSVSVFWFLIFVSCFLGGFLGGEFLCKLLSYLIRVEQLTFMHRRFY